jgi:hypothetical protein
MAGAGSAENERREEEAMSVIQFQTIVNTIRGLPLASENQGVSDEQALVAKAKKGHDDAFGELYKRHQRKARPVRTGRHLVVLTLPLVCWLAAQECPARALLAWAVQHGRALLSTPSTAARARENFDTTANTFV